MEHHIKENKILKSFLSVYMIKKVSDNSIDVPTQTFQCQSICVYLF